MRYLYGRLLPCMPQLWTCPTDQHAEPVKPHHSVGARARLEGKTLSPSKKAEKLKPEAVEAAPEQHDHAHDHDHAHEGHDHAHEGHDHEHAHGPVLNPECTRELVLDVDAAEVDKAFRSVTANYRKYARIPGFRPGKTPESVIRRRFAAEIRKDVFEQLLPNRFAKAVEEQKLKPVTQPNVTELTGEEGKPLHAKAVFEVIPEFAVDGYETVTVDKPAIEVTEEEYKAELEQMLDSRATVEPVEEDRALADGDWAEISYNGKVEGDEAAAPVAGDNALVEIGGKDTVEAFTTALRGAKAGQEIKAEVVYPADYAEPRLGGKTVTYELVVKGIKKRVVPELNDDFAKEMGNYENLADLEKAIREHLEGRKKYNVANETKGRLFAAMAERFTFPVPESLVQERIDANLERGLHALANQGMTPEAMRQLDFARLRAAQRDGALAETKTYLILDKIADKENVTVTDEELDRELQIASLQSREPIDTLRARLDENGGMARVREQIRREKTANLLYDRLPA